MKYFWYRTVKESPFATDSPKYSFYGPQRQQINSDNFWQPCMTNAWFSKLGCQTKYRMVKLSEQNDPAPKLDMKSQFLPWGYGKIALNTSYKSGTASSICANCTLPSDPPRSTERFYQFSRSFPKLRWVELFCLKSKSIFFDLENEVKSSRSQTKHSTFRDSNFAQHSLCYNDTCHKNLPPAHHQSSCVIQQ